MLNRWMLVLNILLGIANLVHFFLGFCLLIFVASTYLFGNITKVVIFWAYILPYFAQALIFLHAILHENVGVIRINVFSFMCLHIVVVVAGTVYAMYRGQYYISLLIRQPKTVIVFVLILALHSLLYCIFIFIYASVLTKTKKLQKMQREETDDSEAEDMIEDEDDLNNANDSQPGPSHRSPTKGPVTKTVHPSRRKLERQNTNTLFYEGTSNNSNSRPSTPSREEDDDEMTTCSCSNSSHTHVSIEEEFDAPSVDLLRCCYPKSMSSKRVHSEISETNIPNAWRSRGSISLLQEEDGGDNENNV